MFVKIVAISCLVAAVSCANAPRRSHVLPSASQVVPQSIAAPADQQAKLAAQQAKLHYVEIGPSLKGDYKFGYDTGSGPAGQSFREETRLDDGTVKGAYGYVDANGKQRIVKYTAGKNGFVVEGDQEAAGQGGASQQAPVGQPQPEVRRPQPVSLPQATAQPSFDEQPVPINRGSAQPPVEDRARAEAQHAEELRQHQLAQQASLAQQQRLAQQLQLQQQQIVAQQAASRQQQPQPQPQQQQQQPQLQQFGIPQQAPQPPTHQVSDPQNGQFFSSSSDSNINQLLSNQLRQLQSGNQFAGQFQPPQSFQPQAQAQPQQQQQQQPQPQHFAGQASPAFQQAAAQFAAPQQQPSGFDFGNSQFRAARQAGQHQQQQQFPQQQQQHQAAHPVASPQSALLALHQQQQHDAQLLANLRAQQQRQAAASAPAPTQVVQQQFQQPQPAELPQQRIQRAPAAQRFAPSQQVAHANQPTPQPEVFGPPVIDIRTLNYSIGQQTQVN